MNNTSFRLLYNLKAFIEDSTQTSAPSTSNSTTPSSSESAKEALMNVVKSPVFYIVIGAIVLLIIAFYLYRRIVKARPNCVVIITRKGKVYKTLDENHPKYFMVPFVDKIGATISLKETEFSSDKLFINNGPDHLYKVNYTLLYKVTDPVQHYPYHEKLQDLISSKLNEDLREFADKGNALVLVKDYREHSQEILDIINQSLQQYQIEVLSFKVNMIEPLGK